MPPCNISIVTYKCCLRHALDQENRADNGCESSDVGNNKLEREEKENDPNASKEDSNEGDNSNKKKKDRYPSITSLGIGMDKLNDAGLKILLGEVVNLQMSCGSCHVQPNDTEPMVASPAKQQKKNPKPTAFEFTLAQGTCDYTSIPIPVQENHTLTFVNTTKRIHKLEKYVRRLECRRNLPNPTEMWV